MTTNSVSTVYGLKRCYCMIDHFQLVDIRQNVGYRCMGCNIIYTEKQYSQLPDVKKDSRLEQEMKGLTNLIETPILYGRKKGKNKTHKFATEEERQEYHKNYMREYWRKRKERKNLVLSTKQ